LSNNMATFCRLFRPR